MHKLKADRPHPRDYPQMPTNYRHTDNHLRLVIMCPEYTQTDGRTDGRYQVHYLPRFAVDKELSYSDSEAHLESVE